MERTKKILNLSIAFSLVVLSLTAFIFSIRGNKAVASPSPAAEGYTPVGTYVLTVHPTGQQELTYLCVVGYNPSAKAKIKMLAASTIPEFQATGR